MAKSLAAEEGHGFVIEDLQISRRQFLDKTVALHKLGLRWLTQGLRFRRVYRFDYNESDEGRRTGYLVMLGQQLLEISMGLPDDAQDA